MVDIVMDGPAKNSLGTEMMDSLLSRLGDAGDDPVLLTGAGDVFCAGLNLKEIAELDRKGMERFLIKLEELVERLLRHPGPTVALVNGHAIAGGYVLTLACDYSICVANPKARIGLTEVAVGVRFPPLIWRLVERAVPYCHLREVVLGAGLYAPDQALMLGLVGRVSDNAEAEARKWLERSAGHDRGAYRAAKHTLLQAIGSPSEAEYETFLQTDVPAWVAPGLKERLRAFLKG